MAYAEVPRLTIRASLRAKKFRQDGGSGFREQRRNALPGVVLVAYEVFSSLTTANTSMSQRPRTRGDIQDTHQHLADDLVCFRAKVFEQE